MPTQCICPVPYLPIVPFYYGNQLFICHCNYVSCLTWLSSGNYNRRGLRQPLVSGGGWVWERQSWRMGEGESGEANPRGQWWGAPWGGRWRAPKGPLVWSPGFVSPKPPHSRNWEFKTVSKYDLSVYPVIGVHTVNTNYNWSGRAVGYVIGWL